MLIYRGVFPLPPSSNHFYTVANGRKVLSARAEAWQKECFYLVKAIWGGHPPMEGTKILVQLQVTFPDQRRRDLDNMLKPCLDILTMGHVWHDDSQVVEIVLSKEPPCKPGKIQVTVISPS